MNDQINLRMQRPKKWGGGATIREGAIIGTNTVVSDHSATREFWCYRKEIVCDHPKAE